MDISRNIITLRIGMVIITIMVIAAFVTAVIGAATSERPFVLLTAVFAFTAFIAAVVTAWFWEMLASMVSAAAIEQAKIQMRDRERAARSRQDHDEDLSNFSS